MAKSDLTRTGARRLGDEYQDLIAADILVTWLEHPTRYEWVKVEADDAGFLDDVVARRSDGMLEVRQVKFSTHPDAEDDPWTWDKLLETSTGKSGRETTSLLQKWSQSIEKLLGEGMEFDASLVSNRRPAPEIEEVLSADGFVDFDQIQSLSTRDAISGQLGGVDAACSFFSRFRFSLDQPNVHNLEETLRRRFYRLGGTDAGWLNLKDELRSWVYYRSLPPPEGTIHLQDIRTAALWYSLQPLTQKFEVPVDYVLPSEQFHEALLEKLAGLRSGCLVLTAPPGYGKSTYSSRLYQLLREVGTPVIRHHYFLSLTDRSGWSRLDHERAAGSLMYYLSLEHSEALGPLASENPHPNKGDLTKWLEACGSYYAARNQSLVVIVDGLDHVWRERKSIEELNKLLGLLLPAPDGVVFFLATQPVDDEQLSPALFRASSRDEWIWLPLLDHGAVTQWLHHHEKELADPGEETLPEHIFTDLADAFYQKSKGHPLYLRYALKALQEQKIPVTRTNVEALPGCPHEDISEYYLELWRALPEEGRAILHLLAACPFAWPRRGILDCLDSSGLNRSQVNSALRQIEHMLVRDELGLRPFHGSLLVFVRARPEHEDYAATQIQLALQWLSGKAPDYWRWAYAWLLTAELGDNLPILKGPSRQWTVEAIAKRRPKQEIDDILSSSIRTALRCGDLPRAIEVGLLREYCLHYNTEEFKSLTIEMLLYPQLFVGDDPHLRARLRAYRSELMDGELALLAEAEAARGNTREVELCFEELQSRLKDGRTRNSRGISSHWRTQIDPIMRVAAQADYPDPEHIIRWAIRNRDRGYTREMLSMFGSYMRAAHNIAGTRRAQTIISAPSAHEDEGENGQGDILAINLSRDEKSGLLKSAVLLALEEAIDLDDLLLKEHNANDPFFAIYAALRKKLEYSPQSFEFPDAGLLSLKPVDHYERSGDVSGFFHQAFFCFLANHLWGNGARNTEWLRAINRGTWADGFLDKLQHVAASLSEMLRAGTSPSFGWFYNGCAAFPKPDWARDHDEDALKYSTAASRAAVRIGLDIFCLFKAVDANTVVTQADLECAFTSGYCYVDAWLEAYVANRRPCLQAGAVSWLLEEQERLLATTIDHFTNRAERYATLASVAALHNMTDEARHLSEQTAENLVSHGNHKDMLFNDVFEAIEACHNAYSSEPSSNWDAYTRSWLLQVAPAIAEITEYTDGDETGHLPRYLANLLAKIAPDLLPPYYEWLTSRDEYYNALHAFHTFLETSNLSDPVNQAIATTAVDDKSLSILAERAQAGDAGAKTALSSLLALLGPNALNRRPPEDSDGSASRHDYTERVVPPGDYPPDELERFLDVLREEHVIYFDRYVEAWIEHWSRAGHKEEVFKALEAAVARGLDIRSYDALFELVLTLYGKDRAYEWLVRAHCEDAGWERYFTDKDRAVRRWHIVKEHYPERWHDFLRDTLSQGTRYRSLTMGHSSLVRIVEYCIFMRQPELVKQLMGTMLAGSLDSVSPLALPIPEWSIKEGE